MLFNVVYTFFFGVSVCLTCTKNLFKVLQILVLQYSYPCLYSQDYSSISACHRSQQNRLPKLSFIASLSLPKLVMNSTLLIKWQLNISFFLSFQYILIKRSLNFLLVQEQCEADLLKAQKAECHALCEKMVLQKAKQLANLLSDGEGEYEPQESPTVGSFNLKKKLYTDIILYSVFSCEVENRPSQRSFGQQSGKVPPAPTPTLHSPQVLS